MLLLLKFSCSVAIAKLMEYLTLVTLLPVPQRLQATTYNSVVVQCCFSLSAVVRSKESESGYLCQLIPRQDYGRNIKTNRSSRLKMKW